MGNQLPFWPEWTVEDKIGQGSYGSVYRIRKRSAGSSGMDIYSAMKVLRIPLDDSEIRNLQSQGMSEASVRRLLLDDIKVIESEIRTMISLASAAGIVTIEDYHIEELHGRIGWNVFIRMELLESLPSYEQRTGTLSQEEILKMACDLCDALSVCESANIIHRDIKPANIFRNRFGQFKLGDFGVAKQMEGTASAGTRVGTPSFEAPEVFLGRKYDHTVDIYGLGIVLYTCLNKGRKPFYPPYPQELTRQNMQEALERRLNGENVPPVPGTDRKLSAIIEKACAFQPERRYQSAAEMKEELERYRYNRNSTPVRSDKKKTETAQSRSRRNENATVLQQQSGKSRKAPVVVGCLVTVILLAGGILGWRLLSGKTKPGQNMGGGMEKAAVTLTETPVPISTPTPRPTSTPRPIRMPDPVSTEAFLIEGSKFNREIRKLTGSENVTFDAVIEAIVFSDEPAPAGSETVTISEKDASDYSVTAWFDHSTGSVYISTEADKVYWHRDSSSMFKNMLALKQIDLQKANTSRVTNMAMLFDACESLEELDLSTFDTSSVANMNDMFRFCEGLKKLDLSGFDTSSVTSMMGMFEHCASLQEINLSGFDTSSVVNMSYMFSSCRSLTELDLSSFDTSAVNNMSGMFDGDSSLQRLDISGFTTTDATNLNFLFQDCDSLTEAKTDDMAIRKKHAFRKMR